MAPPRLPRAAVSSSLTPCGLLLTGTGGASIFGYSGSSISRAVGPHMNWCRRSCLLLLLTFLGLSAHASPGEAFARRILVNGTSSSAGTCQIIIESFGLKGNDNSLAPFIINVAVPISSTASNTATLIRNDVDAALPPDYT